MAAAQPVEEVAAAHAWCSSPAPGPEVGKTVTTAAIREPGLAAHCNLTDLPEVAATPLLGALPEGAAASRSRNSSGRLALAGSAPAFEGQRGTAAFAESQPEPFSS